MRSQGWRIGLLDGREDDEAGIVHQNVEPLEPLERTRSTLSW
jgi:hypothetical protein